MSDSETNENGQNGCGSITKIWIESSCLLHDMCVEICPQVFKIDDQMPPEPQTHIALITPNAKDFFESHRAQIEEAARCCPMAAIKIQYENGVIFDGTDQVSPGDNTS